MLVPLSLGRVANFSMKCLDMVIIYNNGLVFVEFSQIIILWTILTFLARIKV